MRRLCIAAMMAAMVGLAACGSWAQPAEAEVFPAEVDPFMGNYAGRWSADVEVNPEIAAQIIPLGNDRYRIRVVNKVDMRCPPLIDVEATPENGTLSFQSSGMNGQTDGHRFSGGRNRGESTFQMEKVALDSPTLGREAPAGAVVLFDGSGFDAWRPAKGWEITGDGAMMVTPKGEDITSQGVWKDLDMHLEFRLPYMPRARGQQRGNSGLFIQGVYEVQILDSFGLEGYYDECGALYKLAAPNVNACRPPLQWQTYDIQYRAPRYNDAGELEANGRITVYHNGVLIHNDLELKWITAWTEVERLGPPPREAGPIRLQCHGDFIQFRNIWLVPHGD